MSKSITKISNLVTDLKFETVNGNMQLRLIYEEFLDIKIQDFILLYLANADVEVEICGVNIFGMINSIKYIDGIYNEKPGTYNEKPIRFEVIIKIDY